MNMKQRILLTFAMLMTVCTFCVAQGREAYAVLSDGDKTLTFYYDTTKSSYGTNAYELNTEYDYPGSFGSDGDDHCEKDCIQQRFRLRASCSSR